MKHLPPKFIEGCFKEAEKSKPDDDGRCSPKWLEAAVLLPNGVGLLLLPNTDVLEFPAAPNAFPFC